MKKRLTAIFVTLVLALTLLPAAIFAADESGVITVGEGKDYATITAALEAVKAMDRGDEQITLLIDAANFTENIIIETPNVYLKGQEGEMPHATTLTGDNDKPLITINASDVTIEMFEIGDDSERTILIESGDRIFFKDISLVGGKTAIYSSSESTIAFYNCILIADETVLGGKATAVIAKSELETFSDKGGVIVAPDCEAHEGETHKSAFLYNCRIGYTGAPSYLASIAKPEYADNEVIFYRTNVSENGWTSVSMIKPEGFKADVPTKIYEYRTLEMAAAPYTRNANVTVLEKPEIDGVKLHYNDYLGDWRPFKGLDMSITAGTLRGGLKFTDGLLIYSHENFDETVTEIIFEEDVPSVYLGGGSYRFIDKTNTLILNDVEFTTEKSHNVLEIEGENEINITLVGQNSLVSEALNFDDLPSVGIYAPDRELTITGPGTLSIDMQYSYGKMYNLYAKEVIFTDVAVILLKADGAYYFYRTDEGAVLATPDALEIKAAEGKNVRFPASKSPR
ncbi:MAG: hypothetical protein LBM59_03250 [Ruminococcus sp.]|jgi:hypothetical protein|nr:hypothetical protein [Ruminococcus sp.]